MSLLGKAHPSRHCVGAGLLLRLTFGTPGRRGRFLSLDYAGLSRWQPAHSNHSQITGTTLTPPFLCHPSHFLSASPLFPCVRCAGVVGYGGRTLSGSFSTALPRIWPIPSGILGFTSRSTRMQRWRRHRRDPEYRSQNANRAKGGRVRSGTQ